jgi:hypothetical protein
MHERCHPNFSRKKISIFPFLTCDHPKKYPVYGKVWKKLKSFFYINLNTAIKQPTTERYRMTTDTMNATTGGLVRMSDADFEQEYQQQTQPTMIGTPRPGMDTEDAATRQDAAFKAIWTFSQAAKASATALKRRRSLKSRTYYRMAASKQVKLAFDALQIRIEQTPEVMSQADFQLLKQAIGNFRIRLIVHDSNTFDELKEMHALNTWHIAAAEHAKEKEFEDKSGIDEAYINAKNRYLDLKAWGDELAKEIKRIEPKVKYASVGGGLFRHEPNKPTEPPGVASQPAQIAPASGTYLRDILKPETIRRTFISLSTLTNSIRNDVVEFLTDECRHKDRHEVVKQIKECCIAATATATATATDAKQKKH